MFSLAESQKKTLEKIAEKHRLRFIILHGSYAKGTPRPDSDLDIAILGERKPSFDEFLAIYGELGDAFGDTRERELDVKTLHGVDPLFRHLAVRDGMLLYGNPTEYAQYKAYAFRDYMDTADLRELEFSMTRAKHESLVRRYAR